MARMLIVNADDLGRTPGVNEGILRAHREGIVTSATVMMNMPATEEALRLARAEPGLGLGVHLNFTSGPPLLPPDEVSALVGPNGWFLGQDTLAASPDVIDVAQLRSELRTQIERFRALAGEPDHLDCHHFVHLHPRFFEVYLSLAAECGCPVRAPLSHAADAVPNSLVPDASPAELGEWIVRDRAMLEASGVGYPKRFIGAFHGEPNVTVEALLSILSSLGEGITELMTHPGVADRPLREESSYSLHREIEMRSLCDPRVRSLIEDLDICLTTFESVARGAGGRN